MKIDGMELERLSDHPHYHAGRPKFGGAFGSGKGARIWVLCPTGHFVAGVAIREWSGSHWSARINDPTYTVECIGTPATEGECTCDCAEYRLPGCDCAACHGQR
jgi:hypothetical protein